MRDHPHPQVIGLRAKHHHQSQGRQRQEKQAGKSAERFSQGAMGEVFAKVTVQANIFTFSVLNDAMSAAVGTFDLLNG